VPRYSVKVFPGVRIYGGHSRRGKPQDDAIWPVVFIGALVGGVVLWHALGAAIVVLLFVSIAMIDRWWKKRAATKLKLAHEAGWRKSLKTAISPKRSAPPPFSSAGQNARSLSPKQRNLGMLPPPSA
jgi:hypothetical protein